MVIGFIFEQKGVLICNLSISDLTDSLSNQVICNETNSQLYKITEARAFHYNSNDEEHLFVAMSVPPGVIEFNIKNPYMPFIQKIYKDT